MRFVNSAGGSLCFWSHAGSVQLASRVQKEAPDMGTTPRGLRQFYMLWPGSVAIDTVHLLKRLSLCFCFFLIYFFLLVLNGIEFTIGHILLDGSQPSRQLSLLAP